MLPLGITGVVASCSGSSGGASCDAPTVTGSDAAGYTVSGTVTAFPPGGSVTIFIDGAAPAGAPEVIVNTATVTPPAGTTDPTPANNASSSSTSTPVSLQSFEVD